MLDAKRLPGSLGLRYITYFMERVAALQHNQITPYVVFDGGPLPMKKGTEEERRKYVLHLRVRHDRASILTNSVTQQSAPEEP
jgi:hypothetical protein